METWQDCLRERPKGELCVWDTADVKDQSPRCFSLAQLVTGFFLFCEYSHIEVKHSVHYTEPIDVDEIEATSSGHMSLSDFRKESVFVLWVRWAYSTMEVFNGDIYLSWHIIHIFPR